MKYPVTPVQLHRRTGIYYKRDDLALPGVPGMPNGAKWRQYNHFIQNTPPDTPLVVGCAAASAMQVYVAAAGRLHGRRAVVFVAGRKTRTGSTQYAIDNGAEVHEVRPGYMSVVRSRARAWVAANGGACVPWVPGWAVSDTARQCRNVPLRVRRVVVPVGSGLTLVGVMQGLLQAGLSCGVLGVNVSTLADATTIRASWDKHVPEELGPCPEFSLVQAPGGYDQPRPAHLPTGESLDPYYAAKCLDVLRAGDLLWVPGVRPASAVKQTTKKKDKP